MLTENRWRRLTAAETQALLLGSKPVIFDMRDQTSYALDHLDGAQYLSNTNLQGLIHQTSKHQPVLIYCYHGNASQACAQLFADFGFEEVYDLIGGYAAWHSLQASAADSDPPVNT